MKQKFVITFLLVVFFISSCTASPTPIITATIQVTNTPIATATLVPTATQISTATLTPEPKIKSGNGSTPVTLTFVNNAESPIDVYWVDFDRKEILFFSVSPNGTVQQGTYSSHAWRIRDLTGKIVMDVIATSDENQTIVIEASQVQEVVLPPLPTLEPNVEVPEPIIGHVGCVISAPPAKLNLDPFYTKYCDANGIPIISSEHVSDEALGRAWNIIMNLLLPRPDLHQALAENGQYFGVMAEDEVTTDLPEYVDLKNDPVTDWDTRARGLGGFPFSSGAEENLMCLQTDGYYGESITLHEFAHTIDAGLDFIDPQFNKYLVTAHANALEKGLWANTYAATNDAEYWAEGVQSYFNTNLESSPTDGIHNNINTRAELKEYDPELFALIDYIFRGFEWEFECSEL